MTKKQILDAMRALIEHQRTSKKFALAEPGKHPESIFLKNLQALLATPEIQQLAEEDEFSSNLLFDALPDKSHFQGYSSFFKRTFLYPLLGILNTHSMHATPVEKILSDHALVLDNYLFDAEELAAYYSQYPEQINQNPMTHPMQTFSPLAQSLLAENQILGPIIAQHRPKETHKCLIPDITRRIQELLAFYWQQGKKENDFFYTDANLEACANHLLEFSHWINQLPEAIQKPLKASIIKLPLKGGGTANTCFGDLIEKAFTGSNIGGCVAMQQIYLHSIMERIHPAHQVPSEIIQHRDARRIQFRSAVTTAPPPVSQKKIQDYIGKLQNQFATPLFQEALSALVDLAKDNSFLSTFLKINHYLTLGAKARSRNETITYLDEAIHYICNYRRWLFNDINPLINKNPSHPSAMDYIVCAGGYEQLLILIQVLKSEILALRKQTAQANPTLRQTTTLTV